MENGSAPPIDFNLTLIDVSVISLKASTWHHRNLKARFWRLYQHNNANGGILLQGRKVPLLPKFIYLIPPETDFHTFVENGRLSQLFIHFTVAPFRVARELELFQVPLTPWLQQLIEICRSHHADRNIRAERLTAIALVGAALSQVPDDGLEKCGTEKFSIAHLCDGIKNFYPEPMPVARMMEIAGARSKRSFQRHFKAQTGMSPRQYLISQQQLYGQRLLETTNLTLAEICARINVNSPFHFSRTFKKIHGVSPGKFRKNLQTRPEHPPPEETASKGGKSS